MTRKPPAPSKDARPRSLSDADIVSRSSAGRVPPAPPGTDADTDKAPKASDRDAAGDSDKPVRPLREHRAGGDAHKDRD
jgi:hypothetical protein